MNELTKAAWYSTFYRNIFTEVPYSNNSNNSKVTLSWNKTASVSEFDDSLPHLSATTIQSEPFQPRVTGIAPFTETPSRRSHVRIIITTPKLF